MHMSSRNAKRGKVKRNRMYTIVIYMLQDLYHYATSWYSQVSLGEIQSRDGILY